MNAEGGGRRGTTGHPGRDVELIRSPGGWRDDLLRPRDECGL